MKPRKSPNPFENLKEFKDRSQENRQAAYENKVCKKILRNLFKDNAESLSLWETRIKRSETPLLEMQSLFEPFTVRSHRMNTWGMNDLFLRPTKCEVWQTFVSKGGELFAAFPDHIPAILFYNSTLGQDMVIHTGVATENPTGHFRLVRASKSGQGGVVVDTLSGFLTIL
jgi:hypothetical protein